MRSGSDRRGPVPRSPVPERHQGGTGMSDSPQYSLDHVHVLCSDVAASERWFVDGLGAEVVRHRPLNRGAAATDLRIAGVNIFLRGLQEGEKLGEAGPP